jgi:sugar-specific transcriptional regulator TrmB
MSYADYTSLLARMPPSKPQSALRFPFNAMLGTEANVRLLRALVLAETPLAAGELARRASLGRTSIYPALDSLESTGIVEFLGAGAQRQVNFRKAHPLANAIGSLFRAEAERVDGLVSALRRVVDSATPSPTSAWMDGLSLAEKDRFEDAISCYVVADPKLLPLVVDQLAHKLGAIERKFQVHIEVHGLTRSELESRPEIQLKELRDAILLGGTPPTALVPQANKSRGRAFESHEEHDVRARRLAVAIAAKLKWDPGLTRTARQHIARREKKASAQERRELQEWARILATMSASRLRRFLVEPGERATRLRQTLPALGLLTPAEREAVLASTSDTEARAAVLGGRSGRVGAVDQNE